MDRRIFGVETEYALGHETEDRRLRSVEPGQLFDSLDRALVARFETLESDSFGRDPRATQNDGTGIEIREGRFLESGARFYYDTGHLEWATPECTTARQAAIYELAGERTLAELARGQVLPEGGRVLLLKNNIDYTQGATFGCHENYLIWRGRSVAADQILFQKTAQRLVPFLVTRQIFAGAGKLGTDTEGGYQISQRADHIARAISDQTRAERGIVNTRDESLGDARRFRRLHLIVGDSNRSPWANFLKLGTTDLVLQMIEQEALDEPPVLADPVAAIKSISRDLTCRIPVPLKNGRAMSPLELQKYYLHCAKKFFATSADGEVHDLLAQWHRVLDDLAEDPLRTADRVDWAIKRYHLLEPQLRKAETDWGQVAAWGRVLVELRKGPRGRRGDSETPSVEGWARCQFLLDRYKLRWSDHEVQQRLYFDLRERDLRYHDIDPERSLFTLLVSSGRVMQGVCSEDQIVAAQQEPTMTRARLRAEVIRWAHQTGRSRDVLLDWGRVAFGGPNGNVHLSDPFGLDHPEFHRHLADSRAEIPIRILAEEDLAPAEREASPFAWLRKLFSRGN